MATLQRLSVLEGVEFDTAYANAQLAAHIDAVAQFGAYSQDGGNGGSRRYAQGAAAEAPAAPDRRLACAGGR